jgi:hypothetical protein
MKLFLLLCIHISLCPIQKDHKVDHNMYQYAVELATDLLQTVMLTAVSFEG